MKPSGETRGKRLRPGIRQDHAGYRQRHGNRRARERPQLHTREKPTVDGQLGFMSQVAVGLAVESFRQNRVMFFDPVKLNMTQRPA